MCRALALVETGTDKEFELGKEVEVAEAKWAVAEALLELIDPKEVCEELEE